MALVSPLSGRKAACDNNLCCNSQIQTKKTDAFAQPLLCCKNLEACLATNSSLGVLLARILHIQHPNVADNGYASLPKTTTIELLEILLRLDSTADLQRYQLFGARQHLASKWDSACLQHLLRPTALATADVRSYAPNAAIYWIAVEPRNDHFQTILLHVASVPAQQLGISHAESASAISPLPLPELLMQS